ncbi:hypothetical protein ABE021_03460 [Sporosarcina gallistercoris]|uniref:hypothetical protein n=1 Tax=Sporosarcina gallistercoris TaxID=2762245 RepID=UPI003D2D8067
MDINKIGLFNICLLLLCLVGCSSSYNEIISYEKAGINQDFPVPAKAESSKVQFDNPYIKKGEKYRLKNIGGEQGLYPPSDYFEEINTWGWEVLKEEQMGHANFFRKGNTIISIVIHEDYFELYEMDEYFPLN